MTDWLMVIITTIYVIATIVICIFNGKSAKAAREQAEISKKQTKEMIRQYNLTNRPIVTIRFDIVRSGLLCFIVENEGPLPAHDVVIKFNDSFINNLPDTQVKNRFIELKASRLYLASHQKITLLLDGQPMFSKIAEEKAIIEIEYDSFVEKTEIDIKQYGMLLVYNSPIEDISQKIKKSCEQDKKFYDSLIRTLAPKERVVNVITSEATDDEVIKYRLYKEICMNHGCTIQFLCDHFSEDNDKIINLLIELQQVNGWISLLPSNNLDDEMAFRCYKK